MILIIDENYFGLVSLGFKGYLNGLKKKPNLKQIIVTQRSTSFPMLGGYVWFSHTYKRVSKHFKTKILAK